MIRLASTVVDQNNRRVTPTDVKVGARIRHLRQTQSVSQARLAASIGVSYQQLYKYEQGAERISCSRIERAAEVLGVPVARLFDPEPDEIGMSLGTILASNTVLGIPDDPDTLRLAKAFSLIKSNKLRHHLMKLAEHLADGE